MRSAEKFQEHASVIKTKQNKMDQVTFLCLRKSLVILLNVIFGGKNIYIVFPKKEGR